MFVQSLRIRIKNIECKSHSEVEVSTEAIQAISNYSSNDQSLKTKSWIATLVRRIGGLNRDDNRIVNALRLFGLIAIHMLDFWIATLVSLTYNSGEFVIVRSKARPKQSKRII